MRVPDGAGIGKAKVTLSLSGWKGMKVAPATLEVPVEAADKAEEGKEAAKPPAAEGAAARSAPAGDLLQAVRERRLIEEQKLTQQVEAALRKARLRDADEPEAALKQLRKTMLQVWDHPDIGERVRDTLLSRLVASRRTLTKEP